MRSVNPPRDHHYIPQFMLKGWTDPATNLLQRYTRPHGNKIMVEAVPTSAAGFGKFLYEIPGLPPEHAQRLESDFMSEIDFEASKAYELLVQGRITDLTVEQRIAWVRFLLVMFLRTPENLAAYKIGYRGIWSRPSPEVAAKYQSLKQPHHPDTYEEYVARYTPGLIDEVAMREFPKVAQNAELGQHLLKMHWFVLRIRRSSFLISDEPIVMQAGLAKPGGHLAIPLSTNALFLATFDAATQKTIAQAGEKAIVRSVNKLMVERASSLVVALDRSHGALIRKCFGSTPAVTIARLFGEHFSDTG